MIIEGLKINGPFSQSRSHILFILAILLEIHYMKIHLILHENSLNNNISAHIWALILLLSEFSCNQVVQYYNQYIHRVSLDPGLLSHAERELGTHCLHMR